MLSGSILNIDAIQYQRDDDYAEAMVNRIIAKMDGVPRLRRPQRR